MRTASDLVMSLGLAAATSVIVVDTGGCAPDAAPPGPVCGYGERADDDGACAPADTLLLDVDVRTDGRCTDDGDVPDCSFRRGIGVVACPVRAMTATPALVVGECAAFVHGGTGPEQTFAGDAGDIVVAPASGAVNLGRAIDDDCYDHDLAPGRDTLFAPGEDFPAGSFGGADVPAFELTLRGPEPLAVERVTAVTRGEPLRLGWLVDGPPADRVVVVVATYDAALDAGVRISCVGADDGEVVVDAALTALLQPGDDTAKVFVLRQNGAHLEPAGAAIVVEAAATVSDVVDVPLR
jgi:hypothetical protein